MSIDFIYFSASTDGPHTFLNDIHENKTNVNENDSQ